MDGEREIIYLAISNLIISCTESLRGIKELLPEQQNREDIDMLSSILQRAMIIEEKMRKELDTAQRPDWNKL